MRRSSLLVVFSLGCAAAADLSLADALARIGRNASTFWGEAPRYIGIETVHQEGWLYPPRHFRFSAPPADAPEPKLEKRDIVSWYGFTSFRRSPEALTELRRVVAVDGAPVHDKEAALVSLRSLLLRDDDAAKRAQARSFGARGLGGAENDFGELLLLFAKANQANFVFEFAQDMAGEDGAPYAIRFEQRAGAEALHIAEGKNKSTERLKGVLYAAADLTPLHVTVSGSSVYASRIIRHEAKLTYAVVDGTPLPAVLLYRRYVDNRLMLTSKSTYTDWRRFEGK